MEQVSSVQEHTPEEVAEEEFWFWLKLQAAYVRCPEEHRCDFACLRQFSLLSRWRIQVYVFSFKAEECKQLARVEVHQ